LSLYTKSLQTWLTCGHSRIDLNPTPEANPETEEPQGENEGSPRQDGTTEQAQEEASPGHHRGFSSYLSEIRGVRNASVEERLAALRRLRQSGEQERDVNATEEESAEEHQSRRRRLTARLRERFRIRTRQHEEQPRSPSPPLPTHGPSAL
jgi:hypothetical protein